MDKHTPGPWSLYQDGMHQVCNAPTGPICLIADDIGMTAEEKRANARLIAASPRLLAIAIECERLLADFDQAADEDNEAWSEERKALEELRSVIKEATGH